MTAEGLQKLKDELQFLEGTERPRVIAAIAEARDKGDLSENAEYDAAKEEQGKLESKIALLKAKIMDARIIDEKTIKTDEVQILTKVRVSIRQRSFRACPVLRSVRELWWSCLLRAESG